ncbi:MULTISPECIES: mechanosensitive ion channel family protein [unclassified Carboxylicivirga]|uniref:mechanosensitive ion channel family protein n=1 Tax=Carboxylicivirga TaxID=1628153 RepID=UPI003D33660B
MRYNIAFIKKIFLLNLIFFLPFQLSAQIENTIISDSARSIIIPLEKVVMSSVRKTHEVNEVLNKLLSDSSLELEKQRNDSIVAVVDSMLQFLTTNELDSLTSTNLENQRGKIRQFQNMLKNENERLESILQTLTIQNTEIKNDYAAWEASRFFYNSNYNDSVLNETIEEVVVLVNRAIHTIQGKMTRVLSMVANSSKYSIKIDQLLARIDAIKKSRQEELLRKKYPPIYKLNFSDFSFRKMKKYIHEFFAENMLILGNFYNHNQSAIFYYLCFLFILITILISIRYKSKVFSNLKLNFYQDSTLNILYRPISMAFIFWIYSSNLFFQTQPKIIADLSILILIIPLIDILIHLSRKGRRYMAVISGLFLLRFLYYIFPVSSSFNRYILLIIGIIEILFLVHLFRSMSLKFTANPIFNKFINFIILFHLAGAAIGVLTVITGHLRVAEIAIDLPITNTLVGVLLSISSVTLIGLMHLFIDMNFKRLFNFIQKRKEDLKTKVAVIIMVIAVLFWMNYMLQILHVDTAFYIFMDKMLSDNISIGSISFTLWKVLLFFFIIWISVLISRVIKMVLEDDVLKKARLKKGVPRMISVVARFSLITIGIIIAVSAVGMPVNQITIIFSAFGVGIGFGLQNIVNNFVSGIILLFERPVQIGDTIEVGTLIGTVKTMGIRSSNVRTFDGAEVVVPNANLISNEVINWTLSDRKRRIEIISGVAYGSDVHKVQQLLLDILDKHVEILKRPEPSVLFNNLGESSLDFRLLFWTENFDNWIIIKSEVIFMIHDTFYREGISIPFPQRDIHIRSFQTTSENLAKDSPE